MQVPQFNAFMFLENKTQIGKIDEIFGSIKDVVSPCSARAAGSRLHELFSLWLPVVTKSVPMQ